MSTVCVQLTTRYPNGDEHSSHSGTGPTDDADQDLLAIRLRRCWAVHRLRPQRSRNETIDRKSVRAVRDITEIRL